MNVQFSRFALTFAAAAILILAIAAPASAETQTMRSQENFTISVPCANGGAGEDVNGLLKTLTVFSITNDGAGGFHGHLQIKLHGVGIGDITGDTYELHVDSPFILFDHVNDNAGGTQTISANLSADAIGKGGAANFHVTIQGKFTMNANGVVTVDRFDITETCNP
jgi:hypothetical protein